MEVETTPEITPRHIRVQTKEGADVFLQNEANDANDFLAGLSAIEMWRKNTIKPLLSELENKKGEEFRTGIENLRSSNDLAVNTVALIHRIPRLREIEQDVAEDKAAALTSLFVGLNLPEDFKLTPDNARSYLHEQIQTAIQGLTGGSRDETQKMLESVPGNFWGVAPAVCHDISNPLQILQGYSDLILTYWEGHSDKKSTEIPEFNGILTHFPRLESAIDKSAQLVLNEFPKDKVSAKTIFGEISRFGLRARKNLNIDFKMETSEDVAKDLGYVVWSKSWLETLLDNIYQNESKAFRGKEGGKISTSISENQGWLVITIKDDAGGFQDKKLLAEGFGQGLGGWESQEKATGKKVESTRIGMAGQAEAIKHYSGVIIPTNYITEAPVKVGAMIKIILPLHK